MSSEERLDKLTRPSLPWRVGATAAILFSSTLSKVFLNVAARTETHGLGSFLKLLEEREDVEGRHRGLLTVSNHVSVVDDPLIWGLLPYRLLLEPNNIRFSLGSHDICFKNGDHSLLSRFFMLGQTLPTHRTMYSPFGGLFQPTIAQCIRLLSKGPYTSPTPHHAAWPKQMDVTPDPEDPFTSPTSFYTTTGMDRFQAPASYGSRRYSWVHIFPEGKVHQHPGRNMRYFKWGVARLILESDQCPSVVPIWIEGPDQIMHEAREWPRFLPRVGKSVCVTFGEPVALSVWEGFRERWRRLKQAELLKAKAVGSGEQAFEFLNDELREGTEVTKLRMEVTFAVREEILKLRRQRGWPDEDPKAGLMETYRQEGGKLEGKMEDESWVKDT